MSIKIIKKILILSLFYFTFGVLNAEENLKSVGKFKDWESFVLSQDGNKTCFAQSIPVVRVQKKLKRERFQQLSLCVMKLYKDLNYGKIQKIK